MGLWNGVELADVELRGHGLRLRQLSGADVPVVLAGVSDPAMDTRWLNLPHPYTIEAARSFVTETVPSAIDAGAGFELAIVPEPGAAMVGTVNLRPTSAGRSAGGVRAEIGYAVYPQGQGHGYAALASRLMAGWAFEHGLASVLIRCVVGNVASAKTALNAGFGYEGTARAALPSADGPADAASFGRTATDADQPVPRTFPALPGGALSDGELVLRPIEPGDAATVVEDRDNAEQRRWAFAEQGEPASLRWARRFVADAALAWLIGASAALTMVEPATGAPAGFVTVRKEGPPGVWGIGYSVLPDFRGRGYPARALRLVREWAGGSGQIHRLELGAKTDNLASRRAALSGGFTPEGVHAGRLRNPDGSYSDEERFFWLASD